jgi:putative ABC transport system permease protein
VQTTEKRDGIDYTHAASGAPFGEAIVSEIPDVESAAIFRVYYEVAVKVDEKNYRAGNVIFANPDFLEVFTFPVRRGNPATALREPMSVLVTESAVEKYFSGLDPVGQTIKIDNRFELTVTGILKDPPTNTQLNCEFIASHSSLESAGEVVNAWEPFGSDYVYLLVTDGTDPVALEGKLQPILKRNVPAEKTSNYHAYLKPLKKIYFDSWGQNMVDELSPRGEASFIFELGIIACFILVLAVVNFINLSTARTSDRQKEVGMRKVFGAARTNLVGQFLGESAVITFVAMLVSVILYEIFKVRMQDLLPRPMFVDFYDSSLMIALIAGLLVVVSVLAGFYPALYLSRFRPIAVLQGRLSTRSRRSVLRKILVVFQFAVAIIFVTMAVIMSQQVSYVSSMNLGFNHDNMLLLDFEGDDASDNCALMKNQILTNCPVVSATAVDATPGRNTYTYYRLTTENDDTLLVSLYNADEKFLNTFGLRLIQGKGLSGLSTSESYQPAVITSSVAQRLSGNPIGQKINRQSGHYEVVGVVDDFYGGALDINLDASMCVIALASESARTLVLQLPQAKITEAVSAIESQWERAIPGTMFEYTFLEDEIARGFRDQRGQRVMFLALALFSIAIASMGIFGLVSFTAEQRTKEIGVRKVLGASVGAIVALLSREFLILIAIANLIAWPIAYVFMNGILSEHAVRIDIDPGMFLLAGFLSLLVALVTAGSQAWRAATADPVKTLQRE